MFKKAVAFTIILCTLLSSMVGCDKNIKASDNEKLTDPQEITLSDEEYSSALQEETSVAITDNETTTENSTVISDSVQEDTTNQETTTDTHAEITTDISSSTQEDTTDTPTETTTDIPDYINEDEYSKFQASVDSNVYDKWLEEKLDEGIEAPKNIYANYLKLWKKEFELTIEEGKDIITSPDKYEAWKNNLEQWLLSASQILNTEMNELLGSMTQLEVIIPHCELVRQKVIDTKYFLYQLEIQNTALEDSSNTDALVAWRFNDMESLVTYINHTHSFGEWQTVSFNCIEGGTEERYCYCGDNEIRNIEAIGEHSNCKWFIVQEPTKLKPGLKAEQCLTCNAKIQSKVIPAKGSDGLKYQLNQNDMICIITGIGSCSDSTVYIPEYIGECKVIGIADGAFTNTYSIQSVVLPNTITSIGESAFAGCTALTTINIPEGVTEIKDGTFTSCVELSKIELPSSITSIGDCAFLFCDKLTKINIPANVTFIHSIAFASCPMLSKITVDENNSFYKSVDDNLYTKDGSILIQYAIGKKDKTFTAPDGVARIDASAFMGCESLTEIILPEGLEEIGISAFSYCRSLESITIPRTVERIRYGAFNGCKKLSTIIYTGSPYEWENYLIFEELSEIISNVTIHFLVEDGK